MAFDAAVKDVNDAILRHAAGYVTSFEKNVAESQREGKKVNIKGARKRREKTQLALAGSSAFMTPQPLFESSQYQPPPPSLEEHVGPAIETQQTTMTLQERAHQRLVCAKEELQNLADDCDPEERARLEADIAECGQILAQ